MQDLIFKRKTGARNAGSFCSFLRSFYFVNKHVTGHRKDVHVATALCSASVANLPTLALDLATSQTFLLT